MKTVVMILAAALLATSAAHAAPPTKSSASKKLMLTKQKAPKPTAQRTTKKSGQVLNYSLNGTPFYSNHRVLSMQ